MSFRCAICDKVAVSPNIAVTRKRKVRYIGEKSIRGANSSVFESVGWEIAEEKALCDTCEAPSQILEQEKTVKETIRYKKPKKRSRDEHDGGEKS